MLWFEIPGEPCPMPQGEVVWAKNMKPPRYIKVMPKWVRQEQFKIQTFARAAIKELPGYPLAEALLIGMCFVRRRPERIANPRDLRYPSQRPDLENYEELLADALTGFIYDDDSLIVGHLPWPLHGKHYATDRRSPGIEVYVLPLSEVYFETINAETHLSGLGDLIHDWRKRHHESQETLPLI